MIVEEPISEWASKAVIFFLSTQAGFCCCTSSDTSEGFPKPFPFPFLFLILFSSSSFSLAFSPPTPKHFFPLAWNIHNTKTKARIFEGFQGSCAISFSKEETCNLLESCLSLAVRSGLWPSSLGGTWRTQSAGATGEAVVDVAFLFPFRGTHYAVYYEKSSILLRKN